MKKQRVLALMHEGFVPPEDMTGVDLREVDWKMEYDVTATLENMGHGVRSIGVGSDLGVIRRVIKDFRPHIVFNLLEDFYDVAIYDQNVVSYLELLRVPYTGSNPRGLLLSRDKALAKKLLAYHRIPVPDFVVFRRGRIARHPQRLPFPLIVKSIVQDSSVGISQASVVEDEDSLLGRVAFIHESLGTDAMAERYIDGRELYVGILGNRRLQVLPTWELKFSRWREGLWPIATGRVKWSSRYQKKYGIRTGVAKNLPAEIRERVQRLCKRAYRILGLSGYARIDLRLNQAGRVYVLEVNPNPQLAYGEDFAESAHHVGISYEQLLQKIINLGRRYQRER